MIHIRQITSPHDPDSDFIQSLVQVFRAARKDKLQFSLDLHDAAEDSHFLSEIVLPTNHVWIAQIDAAIAGFIAFNRDFINHLYIAPQFQRQGLGRQLLTPAKQSARRLQLWVFQTNAPAIQFYQKERFTIVETTDGIANESRMPDFRMEWQAQMPTLNG